jgi:transcription-repair coupling factor (superfamily II helicase)
MGIGIHKINIYDDKAEITLKDKSMINTSKIIHLIQTKPQQFQLKNQSILVLKEEMEADFSRIRRISKVLSNII